MQENPHESVYNYRVSIQDKLLQFKGLIRNPDVILTALIIGVSLVSFYLGRVSVDGDFKGINQEAQALRPRVQDSVQNPQKSSSSATNTITQNAEQTQKGYVASKSGTKYHLPWCGSAKQIKEENKIWFVTKEEAEKAGYTPASNCKGI